MTESIDTAPLRGQSLRGRPVHEICTPVNQGNQLLLRRRGGGGLATALPSGRSQTMFSECESRTLLVSDHPVWPASVASHHFINGAATPPLQGGECAWPINTSP